MADADLKRAGGEFFDRGHTPMIAMDGETAYGKQAVWREVNHTFCVVNSHVELAQKTLST
ncbi:MAG: hypothetical protein EOP02_07235 [Proteobacteria bacterium]|nr:MAG: hypothetical protein EOP02_07235 [Pseudomonadota bacterium]